MYGLIEILKYSIPAAILAVTFYLMYKEKGRRDDTKSESQRQHEKQLMFIKTMIPLRIQAYERIVLLLERITPQNLIIRVNRSGMTAIQLKSALTGNIREEFEHNLSQQIYISGQSWELVTKAKEDMINLINTSYAVLPANASASDLIRSIFDKYVSQENPSVMVALHSMKQEMGNQNK